jgi:hypothetical protein
MAAGRFVYKRISRARTAYGVTQHRAMIVTAKTFRDLPLQGVPVAVHRGRSGRRVSVTMGPADPVTVEEVLARRVGMPWPRTGRNYSYFEGTGLERLFRPGSVRWPFTFYDVDNPDALLAAINRAQTGSTW